MKISKSLFYVLMLLVLASCGQEEESQDLVGTWNLQEFEYAGTSTIIFEGESSITDFEGEARDITATVVFDADGTFQAQGSYTIDLTSDFGGQVISTPVVINNFLGSGTYELDGTTLTTTDDQTNQTGSGEITRLDGANLELFFPFTQTTVQQGVESMLTLEGQYKMTR